MDFRISRHQAVTVCEEDQSALGQSPIGAFAPFCWLIPGGIARTRFVKLEG